MCGDGGGGKGGVFAGRNTTCGSSVHIRPETTGWVKNDTTHTEGNKEDLHRPRIGKRLSIFCQCLTGPYSQVKYATERSMGRGKIKSEAQPPKGDGSAIAVAFRDTWGPG